MSPQPSPIVQSFSVLCACCFSVASLFCKCNLKQVESIYRPRSIHQSRYDGPNREDERRIYGSMRFKWVGMVAAAGYAENVWKMPMKWSAARKVTAINSGSIWWLVENFPNWMRTHKWATVFFYFLFSSESKHISRCYGLRFRLAALETKSTDNGVGCVSACGLCWMRAVFWFLKCFQIGGTIISNVRVLRLCGIY